ncbi:FmdB family zinc ribbon protein [Terrabacter aerolatus]|uniref:FmdB family zinc ribbon protein n=1 Tax=Terrabacter aerolatus TaxID=422442 RepID=UPI0011BE1311|nr:FmdB family zinc ribbon protein [Terrabacter aerolatus]
MPTYSYACQECGHAFDIRQSFTDDSLTVCPECGEPRLRKVIHPVGISFKGSGFYKTDSRASAKSASTPAAAGSGDTKKDTGSTTSSDSTSSSSTSGSSTSGSTTAPAPASGASGSSSSSTSSTAS